MVGKEKREELVEALTLSYSSLLAYNSNQAIAEILADLVIKTGWQWHPPVTEENIDFNEVSLLPTPEQEIDMVDRIISGLPVNPVGMPYRADEWPDSVKLYDVNSLHPAEYTEWRRIPEFDNYEMNRIKVVRSRWTKRVLDVIEEGGSQFVEMHDKDGHAHYISVDYIVERVFV